MKDKFIQFLRDNDALEKFEANCKGHHALSLTVEEAYEDCEIDTSFRWSTSPEGYDYWNELDNKWRDAL